MRFFFAPAILPVIAFTSLMLWPSHFLLATSPYQYSIQAMLDGIEQEIASHQYTLALEHINNLMEYHDADPLPENILALLQVRKGVLYMAIDQIQKAQDCFLALDLSLLSPSDQATATFLSAQTFAKQGELRPAFLLLTSLERQLPKIEWPLAIQHLYAELALAMEIELETQLKKIEQLQQQGAYSQALGSLLALLEVYEKEPLTSPVQKEDTLSSLQLAIGKNLIETRAFDEAEAWLQNMSSPLNPAIAQARAELLARLKRPPPSTGR